MYPPILKASPIQRRRRARYAVRRPGHTNADTSDREGLGTLDQMAKYRVNKRGVAKARELIDARQYRVRSRWADVQPPAAEQNSFLKANGWEEYSSWHLALTDGPPDETKARYAFVFGDFHRLHRMGLIACYYRAAGETPKSCSPRTTCSSTSTSRERDRSRSRDPERLSPGLGEATGRWVGGTTLVGTRDGGADDDQVIADITMSLDGFVTAPNAGPEAGLGDDGMPLHDWVFRGHEIDQAVLGDDRAQRRGRDGPQPVRRRRQPRRLGRRLGYGAHNVGRPPFFVVTHAPPRCRRLTNLDFTFVTGGVAATINQARALCRPTRTSGHGRRQRDRARARRRPPRRAHSSRLPHRVRRRHATVRRRRPPAATPNRRARVAHATHITYSLDGAPW